MPVVELYVTNNISYKVSLWPYPREKAQGTINRARKAVEKWIPDAKYYYIPERSRILNDEAVKINILWKDPVTYEQAIEKALIEYHSCKSIKRKRLLKHFIKGHLIYIDYSRQRYDNLAQEFSNKFNDKGDGK